MRFRSSGIVAMLIAASSCHIEPGQGETGVLLDLDQRTPETPFGPYLAVPPGAPDVFRDDFHQAVIGVDEVWIAHAELGGVLRYDKTDPGGVGFLEGRRSEFSGTGVFSGLAMLADTVVFSDLAVGGVHLLSREGRTLSLRRWETGAVYEPPFLFSAEAPTEVAPMEGGRGFIRPGMTMLSVPEWPGGRVARSILRVPLLIAESTTASWRVAAYVEEEQVMVLAEGGEGAVISPFGLRDMAVPFPDGRGFAVLRQVPLERGGFARVTLLRHGADGSVSDSVLWRMTPVAYSSQELHDVAGGAQAVPTDFLEGADAVLEFLRDGDVVPRYAPVVKTMRADQAGRIWLELRVGSEVRQWIAIDAGGAVVARFDDPSVLSVVGGREDQVVLLRQGQSGELQYQLTRLGSGGSH